MQEDAKLEIPQCHLASREIQETKEVQQKMVNGNWSRKVDISIKAVIKTGTSERIFVDEIFVETKSRCLVIRAHSLAASAARHPLCADTQSTDLVSSKIVQNPPTAL